MHGLLLPGRSRCARRQERGHALERRGQPAPALSIDTGQCRCDFRAGREILDIGRRDGRHRPGPGPGGRRFQPRYRAGSGARPGRVSEAARRPVAVFRAPVEPDDDASEHPPVAGLDHGTSCRRAHRAAAGGQTGHERAQFYARVPARNGHQPHGIHRHGPLRSGAPFAGRQCVFLKTGGRAGGLA
ncbi:hypothetical protein D3C72_1552880 [compost metagenome]